MATVEDVQAELVRIQDLRATLGADDLAGKHACDLRVDQLRHQLKTMQADALVEAKAEWAGRAGNKGSHEQDPEAEAAMAAAMMPGEGGVQ